MENEKGKTEKGNALRAFGRCFRFPFFVFFFSIFLLTFLRFAVPASASGRIPEQKVNAAAIPVDPSAYAAILVADVASGKTLYAHEPAKVWTAASLTKLMTARVFTSTPTNWLATGNITSADEVGGGRLQLPSGTTMSLRDVLYSAIIGSANNAAEAMARMFDGRGASAFVQEMNGMAARFGLSQSRYNDPSGMNPENTTSAYDIATLLLEASQEPETQRAMALPTYSFKTRSPVIAKTIKNTNDLLFMEPGMIVTAGKTGFLYESKYNYAVKVHPKDDPSKELVIVVLGAATRADSVNAAIALAKWAWSAFTWNDAPSSPGVTQNSEMGDRGEEILTLQTFLNANGFKIASVGPGSPGKETTYYGSLTHAAVKRFQEANRVDVLDPHGTAEGTGYVDMLTRAAINAYEPKTPPPQTQTAPAVQSSTQPRTSLSLPPMGAGSIGAAVRTLQELLAREKDVYPDALVTGYFGPLTESAVQRFQLKHGVVLSNVDPGYGYVGPKTRAKLAEMYGS